MTVQLHIYISSNSINFAYINIQFSDLKQLISQKIHVFFNLLVKNYADPKSDTYCLQV